MNDQTSFPILSVVVVTWNSERHIARCLQSLQQDLVSAGLTERGSAGTTCECFVVDCASGDGTVSLIQREFSWVWLLPLSTNVGFTAANNIALRKARGRYVLLLNPDTAVLPGAVATLLGTLERHPNAAVSAPKLLNTDGSLQFSTYRFPTPQTVAWEYFLRDQRRPHDPRAGRYGIAEYDRERAVEGVLGAAMLVRGEAIRQVGLLDERYTMYCEEVDWCLRFHRSGWAVWYTPEACMVHYGGQSARLAASRTSWLLQQSRFKLYWKWYSPPVRLSLQAITRLGMLYQLIFWAKQALRGRISRAEWFDRAALSLRVAVLRPTGLDW